MGETDGLRLVGPKELEERTAVVSVDCMQMDNAEVAFRLDSEYGIMTRCGLHCAPNAHKTLGTYPPVSYTHLGLPAVDRLFYPQSQVLLLQSQGFSNQR